MAELLLRDHTMTDFSRVYRVARLALLGVTPFLAGPLSSQQPTGPGALPASLIGRSATEIREADRAGLELWETETFSRAAAEQLQNLADWLKRPSSASASLSAVLSETVQSAQLRAPDLRQVWSDGVVEVWRSTDSEVAATNVHLGATAVTAALTELRFGFGPAAEIETEFEIVGVRARADTWETIQHVSISAFHPSGTVEYHGSWQIRWQEPGQELPRISSITLLASEEARSKASSGGAPQATSRRRWFSDATASVLGHNPSYWQQLEIGTSQWLRSIETSLGTDFIGHAGVSVGDVNGDLLDDVYVAQGGGLPNRLYLHQPDGTATDHSSASGADWLDRTLSALIVDLDNDGDQDLVVATEPALLLMSNDGSGHFRLRAALDQIRLVYSLAAADFDADGDLDLYAARYSPLRRGLDHVPYPIPYNDANNGADNRLLRNDGDFEFVDATAANGLTQNNSRWSFAAAWEDYDNDGDPDLYVANDFGRNNLYRNQGGQFRDVAAEAGVEDAASGMSVSWGDADRDGWMDLYVGNMFSSAGQRITFQRNFRPELPAADRARLQRLARGNSLFSNRGDGTFRDDSERAGVTDGRWAWSSSFVDLNNDGWQDLVVANGFLTAPDPDDL